MKVEYTIDDRFVIAAAGEFLNDERNQIVKEAVRDEIYSIVRGLLTRRKEEIEERIWKQIEWSIADSMSAEGGKTRINRMADIMNRVIKKEIEKYEVSL